MTLSIILAGIALLLFPIYLYFKGRIRVAYLNYVVLLIPFMDLGVTPAFYGGLSVFDIISYISLFLFIKDFIHPAHQNKIYLYLFLGFLSLLFLGSLASEFPAKSLLNVLSAITPFIFIHLLIRELRENENYLPELIKNVKIAAITGCAFMLIQILIGIGFTFYPTLNQNVFEEGKIRYPGFFMDSQMNGLFFSMTSFYFLLCLKKPNNPNLKYFIQFSLLIAAIVLAGSRSALLGFLGGFILILIFVGGNLRITLLTFSFLIGGLLFYFSDSIVLLKRFNSIDDSYSFRASIWDGAYEIYKKNTSLGIGINNYQEYVKLHSQDQFLLIDNDEIFYLDQPENGYLKLLVEFGIFAFSLLFLMIIIPIGKMFSSLLKGKKVITPFFFAAPIIAWLISFSSLYTLSDSRIIIILGISLALCISYPKEPKYIHEQ